MVTDEESRGCLRPEFEDYIQFPWPPSQILKHWCALSLVFFYYLRLNSIYGVGSQSLCLVVFMVNIYFKKQTYMWVGKL